MFHHHIFLAHLSWIKMCCHDVLSRCVVMMLCHFVSWCFSHVSSVWMTLPDIFKMNDAIYIRVVRPVKIHHHSPISFASLISLSMVHFLPASYIFFLICVVCMFCWSSGVGTGILSGKRVAPEKHSSFDFHRFDLQEPKRILQCLNLEKWQGCPAFGLCVVAGIIWWQLLKMEMSSFGVVAWPIS